MCALCHDYVRWIIFARISVWLYSKCYDLGGIGEIPKPKSPPKPDQSLSSKTPPVVPSGGQEVQEEETVIEEEEDQAGDGWDDEDWGDMDVCKSSGQISHILAYVWDRIFSFIECISNLLKWIWNIMG